MNFSEADSNRYVPNCLFSVMKSAKDQLISKCLFGVNSHKKGTETIRLEVPYEGVKSKFFVCFFGRIEDTKKTFRN